MSSLTMKSADGSTVKSFDAGSMKVNRKKKPWQDKQKDRKQQFLKNGKVEQFPGRKPVSRETLKKYDFGSGMKKTARLTTTPSCDYKRHKLMQKEKILEKGKEDTARSEFLLPEQTGCIEASDGFATTALRQSDIVVSADITTKQKSFDLKLHEFGPYRFQYFRDGRRLALAGELGHIATLDSLTKKLVMEINVMESVHDIAWLQDSRVVAVAQKKWTSIYDDHGIELHCVKGLHEIVRLDYLPYHFLLTGLSSRGLLHYLDVSLGKELTTLNLKSGHALTMAHNPYNGVVTTAHVGGTVCMWTPNSSSPVASVLCHKSPVTSVAYDPSGRYMMTASRTRELRVWDARNLGTQLLSYKAGLGLRHTALSQSGIVALGFDRHVQMLRGLNESRLTPYMSHPTDTQVHQLQFCPYEDVLGISTQDAFSSIIVPGSGEANFDAMEVNIFSQNKSKQEAMIKGLLQKIPSELITLDPITVAQVDVPTLEEKLEARRRLIHVNVPRIDPKPRHRMKGKGGSAQIAKRKLIKKDLHKSRHLDHMKKRRIDAGLEAPIERKDKHKEKIVENILDRFK